MPKVLFVATVVREHINVFHIPFLKLFKENGWETFVAARNDFFENPQDCMIPYCDMFYDIPFERSPLKGKNLIAYKQLESIINRENFDIIHCHTPVGAMITRLASRNARKHGTKVIYTAHGFHFYDGAPWINWLVYYPVEKALSCLTDTLITINQQDYQRAKKFMAKDVRLVPGVGIDRAKFFIGDARDEIIREFSLDEETFIISTVGELIKRKNYPTLLATIEKLKHKKVVCLICGRGVQEKELLAYVKEHNLEKHVRFLGFRNDIARILNGSDIFIFTSFQEGLPVAVMEAMGCGKPVIASNIRGNADLIVEGKNGFLLPPKDVEGFYNKIDYLMNNPNVIKMMGIESSKMIQPYVLDNILEEMKTIYFPK